MIATVTGGVVSCGRGEGTSKSTEPQSAPVAGRLTAIAAQPAADSDSAARNAGLPPGYSAVPDIHTSAGITGTATSISYSSKDPGRWELLPGPAHILYSDQDTAATRYMVSATFEQLGPPRSSAEFGVFVGGTKLGSAAARYTYFAVRGDGKYMAGVRDGPSTRTITGWTTHPSIPRQDAAGRGLYGIELSVKDGAVAVTVNGVPVTTISGRGIPLNGITGVRVGEGLHVIVTPVRVIR